MPETQLLAEMGKYNEELVKAGIMLGGEGLHPSSKGKKVRFAGSKRTVVDGPFAEAKELIAGYWLWQVKSMDEAVRVGQALPEPDERRIGDRDPPGVRERGVRRRDDARAARAGRPRRRAPRPPRLALSAARYPGAIGHSNPRVAGRGKAARDDCGAGYAPAVIASDETLTPFADGIWISTEPVRFLGLRLTSTMTVIRLGDGSLLLYSPVAMTPARRAAVDALGSVAHLYAPNTFHHRWIGDWAAAFPAARLHAPPDLAKKRRDLRIDRVHGAGAPEPAFAGVVDELRIDGFRLQETVLLYAPARTLVVADLVHNIGRPHTAGPGRIRG